MSFQLPPLPFPIDALEPVISANTLEFHYHKHHQAYVNNLNKFAEGTDLSGKSLEEIIRTSDGGIFNNAAQVWNHTFYWESMHAPSKIQPGGKILELIEKNYGTLEGFKEQFTQASVSLFGSGWTWLLKNTDGSLTIRQGSNAWNPLKENLVPLLTCDVWEHAYYLDYQNRRPDYVKAYWDLVNWDKIEQRL